MVALAQRDTARRWASLGWSALLAAVCGAGIVLRVWVYRSSLGVPNSDEAVVGLMARHILHGEIPTFFWGQAYGGSQEALLTVPGFLIAGSGWLALRAVPIVLSGVAALLVWRVGLRTIGEPGARLSAALFWIWPPFLVFQLTHQQGFYGSDVVYCALLLLLGLRMVEQPDRVRVGLFGLVLGLAFWETSQIVPIALCVVAWTAWKEPRVLRNAWLGVALAALGALPWISWNARHDWMSLSLPSGGSSTYLERLRVLFSPVLPMIVGLRAPLSQERLLPAALTLLMYAVVAGLFLYGAVTARRGSSSLLYVSAGAFPFIAALAPQTAATMDPRYLVVLTPVLALLVAQLGRKLGSAALVLALALAVSTITLQRMEPVPPPQPMAPRDIAPLIATLERLGLDRVYAKYWVAYVLDFDTRERIVAVENHFDSVSFRHGEARVPDDPVVRYPPYQARVRDDARHGFVFFRQGIASVPIVEALQTHGYRRYLVGPFVVFAPPAGLAAASGTAPAPPSR